MDFVNFLSALSSSDNSIRHAAEIKYKCLQDEKGDALPLLLLQTAIRHSSSANETVIPQHIRKLSAVLLRRLLIEQEESAYISMTTAG